MHPSDDQIKDGEQHSWKDIPAFVRMEDERARKTDRAGSTLFEALTRDHEDSCAQPRDTKGCANHFPVPVPLSQLKPLAGQDGWLLHGLLLPGAITLLTALWKSGKTTWLSHLLARLDQDGTFIGLDVKAAKVLIVSEESPDLWIERRDRLKLGDHVHIVGRPFKKKPYPKEWSAFIDNLATLVEQHGYNLVVIDPLANFWPVMDENDATQVIAALNPLRQVTEKGVAVLLLMHPRKSDGAEATATRGSGAIPAFVDILIEMRRMSPNDTKDRRRVVTGNSRYRETPAELVIELSADEDSYTVHGDRAEAGGKRRDELILDILHAEPSRMLTSDEIREDWPTDTKKPSKRTLEQSLSRGVEEGRWHTAGEGVKGNPRRYGMSPADSDEPSCSLPFEGRTPFDND